MTTNILTKALNQLGQSAQSSPFIQRWVNFGTRLSDATEAFRVTWTQGKMPSVVAVSDMDEGDTEQAGDADGETTLVPANFAHFSDGEPLTATSLMMWKQLKPHERVRRNSQHLQEAVLRWQDLKDEPLPGMTTKAPKLRLYYFVFMHIPKAGGTTLQHIMSKAYLPNQLIHANGPEIIRHPGVLFNMRRKEPRPIITGHFDRGGLVYEFLNDRPIIHFTMFRDPVKRVLSHFNYLKTRQGHRTHSKVKDLTLEEYVTSSIREACNKQTLRILGYSSEDAWERSLTDPEPLLEEAKQVLEQEFTFFGLTERYTEFLLMAKMLLGWQDIVYQRRNTSNRNSEAKQIIESNPISEEALQLIRDRNQLDIQLYAFASELFDQRCKMLGIDDAAVKKYDQISQTYQTVLADLRVL